MREDTVMVQTDELKLDSIDSRQWKAAAAAFDACDGVAFAAAGAGRNGMLSIVIDNWNLLQSRNMCEAALTHAVFCSERNNLKWGMAAVDRLFASLDREKLLACGDPLPPGETFVLYRGVSGAGQRRQIRGLSWTSSFDCACWFADRTRDFGDPGVYSAMIPRSDVYGFLRRHGREDFIVRPRSVRRLVVAVEDLRERHARIEADYDGVYSPQEKEF